MKASPASIQNNKTRAETIADGFAAVMDLKSINSSDRELNYIAEQGHTAFEKALQRMERLNSLPQPKDVDDRMLESFCHFVYGHWDGIYNLGADTDQKQQAINTELWGLIGAMDQAKAAQLLLPKVAEKYAAPFSTAGNEQIQVHFDESWFQPHDWLCLYNPGPLHEDCTILVELHGQGGEVCRNVHFVQRWEPKSWMCARYRSGQTVLGRKVERSTVTNVQAINVTLWSPTYSFRTHYVYTGEEKDKRIAEHHEKLAVSGRYQPFAVGFASNTQRGAKLTLNGVPFLKKCRVDLTFRSKAEARAWYWELDYWKNGEEKVFATPVGGLGFDPDVIEVVISFPGNGYQYRSTVPVK